MLFKSPCCTRRLGMKGFSRIRVIFVGHNKQMNEPRTTDAVLLARLVDPLDRDAWSEFVEIYRPLVIRLAQRLGLQYADADGLAQEVLLKVGKQAELWQPKQSNGSFRRWLSRVARNAAIDMLRRSRPDVALGGTELLARLNNVASKSDQAEGILTEELERQAFRWAANRIRREFRSATWAAFWETMVCGRSCKVVADDLGKSVGAIYIARTRVLQRLREEVEQFEWES